MSAYSPRLPDASDVPPEPTSTFDDLLRADGRRIARRRRISHIASFAVEAAVLFGLILLFFYRVPQVDGQSMEPKLSGGEHVLIDTLAFDFRVANPGVPDRPLIDLHLHQITRNDLVAFEHGSGDDRRILLKRVVGLAGDTVAIAGGRVIVPAGTIFVLGDNRAQSDDSRAFGPVPVASVIGRATLVVWPLTRVQRLR